MTVSADCADAYVLLAEETAKTVEEARSLYEQGVAAGERALGQEMFEQDAGHFWGILNTRPYMRARHGLAISLLEMGEHEQAIEHFKEMLRLNPNDNQGVRYLLLPELLRTGKRQQARSLLNQYREEVSAAWAYSRALLAFQEKGASRQARRLLDKAISVNPYVPAYLLGLVSMPDEPPLSMGFGDENEAMYYTINQFAAWDATDGALEWLAQITREELSQMLHDLESGHDFWTD